MCRSLIFRANQTGMYIFEPVFINVNKPSMLQSYKINSWFVKAVEFNNVCIANWIQVYRHNQDF